MIEAVIDAERPPRSNVLAQRTARAYGRRRSGGLILKRLDLRRHSTTSESRA